MALEQIVLLNPRELDHLVVHMLSVVFVCCDNISVTVANKLGVRFPVVPFPDQSLQVSKPLARPAVALGPRPGSQDQECKKNEKDTLKYVKIR